MLAGLNHYFATIKSFHREAKLFLVTSFVLQFLNGGYQVIFNLYLNALGHGSDVIGTIGMVRLVIGALVAIPLGILTTRIGYRRSLNITGVMIVFSIFGLAVFNSVAVIYVLSTVWGVAFVLRGIVTAPFLASYSGDGERAHLFGVTFSLHMWASMLGNFLGGSMTDGLKNVLGTVPAYQVALMVFGVFSIFGMIPMFFMKPDIRTKDESLTEVMRNVVRVAKKRDIVAFLIYNALIGTGAGLVIPLFNIFLKLRLNASDLAIGTLMSLTQVSTSIGCLLTPMLIRVFGHSMAVVVSQALSIPFLLVVGGVPFFPVVAGAYLLRHSLMNMVNPIIDSVSMQVVEKKDREATSSLIKTVNHMGRGVGEYFSGILLASGSYLTPYMLTCVLYISGSLVFFFAFRSHEKLNPAPVANSTAPVAK